MAFSTTMEAIVAAFTVDRLLLVLLLVVLLVMLRRQQATEAAVQRTQAAVQETRTAFTVELQTFKQSVSHSLSAEMLALVRRATFAILDNSGLPVCCGFFVTGCGVALTAAHEAEKWLPKAGKKGKKTVRAATNDNKEFDLEVMQRKVGDLDIAVLRLSGPASQQPCLPLPETTFEDEQLVDKPIKLIHSSIAYSHGLSAFGVDSGSITTSNATRIHYSVSTRKGDSGAALLLHGEQVIGLHSEDVNDLPQAYSEISPSTSGDAVRLDLPAVKAAVKRFMKAKTA